MSNFKRTDSEKTILLEWLQRFGSRFRTGFIVTDPYIDDNPVVFVNGAFTEMTGYAYEDVIGANLRFMQGEDTDMERIREIDQELLNCMPVNAEVLNYKKDGTPFWNELVIQPIVDEKGNNLFTISFSLDITERKKDELLLKLQEDIFVGINTGEEPGGLLQKIATVAKSPFMKGAICSILFTEKGNGWYIGAADAVPDRLLEELLNKVVVKKDLLSEDVIIMDRLEAVDEEVMLEDCPTNAFHSSCSIPMIDGDGDVSGMLTVFFTKSDKSIHTQIPFLKKIIPIIQMTRKYYTQQAEYRRLAFTDPETGLPNRQAFLKKLKNNIQNGGNHFVAVLEPGEYAKIVDLYGRGAADELFIQLGSRIEQLGKRSPNFVGRFSSAALVLTNQTKRDDDEFYILALKKVVSTPFTIAGQEIYITLKIGIALSADNWNGEEDLLRRADNAMSNAKKKPGNAVSFYRDLQYEETIKEMKIFNELSKALMDNEIQVFLQPQVDLKNGNIIAFEALARWFSPILGQVPPDLFIPAAESIGKIIELEICILSKVMEWQRTRQQTGEVMYQVAVNISAQHFFAPNFVDILEELTSNYDLSPRHFKLELTESIGLSNLKKAKEIFDKLNEVGFEMSVDDFGVGFSSLSYLPQLPLSEIKIDRSFINAMGEPATLAVVRTIIQLAVNLNLSTVAEGIEEEWQAATLRALGCHVGQGFYYYKPMPLVEIDRLLIGK